MQSYLWVLKYVLQTQNVGRCLIRQVFLQGVQLLITKACMPDLPVLCLCCEVGTATVCVLPQLILLNIASLDAGCTGKCSFGLVYVWCGLVFSPHILSCVRHNGSLISNCHGIKDRELQCVQILLCAGETGCD